MRKRIIITLIAVAVAGFAVWLLKNRTYSTLKNEFVIPDTSVVTKIFLADMNNNTVTISRTKETGWILNNGKAPIVENVDLLLKTFLTIRIKNPVSKTSNNTAVKRLATNAIKVEIYTTEPAVNIFGLKLFTKERLKKIYYVGGPTQDNRGTIMKTGKGDKLYVTDIPGFNGYLTERFSPKIADWQNHIIFSEIVGNIKSVTVDLPETPNESYKIVNNQNRTFTILKAQDNYSEAGPYDTIRVLDLLSAFNSIKYESLLDDMPKSRLDSLKSSIPFKIVTLETFDGKTKTLKMYHRYNFDKITDTDGKPFPFDVDRMYGFAGDDTVPVTVQFFVTDNITRPLSYLLNAKQDTTAVRPNGL